MTNTLIAYYSLTGNTRQVAEMIAEDLDAFIETIDDSVVRRGFLGYMRSGWEGLRGKISTIKKPEKHPEQFDLVIIGTPIWAGGMSSPVRSYLSNHPIKDGKVALFCTSGGTKNDKVIRDMAKLAGQDPVASLIVIDRDLKSGALKGKVDEFVAAISEQTAAAA